MAVRTWTLPVKCGLIFTSLQLSSNEGVTFRAHVAFDDTHVFSSSTTVLYEVVVDGAHVWRSLPGVIGAMEAVVVPVYGASKITLRMLMLGKDDAALPRGMHFSLGHWSPPAVSIAFPLVLRPVKWVMDSLLLPPPTIAWWCFFSWGGGGGDCLWWC